jgi:hypothetical protein
MKKLFIIILLTALNTNTYGQAPPLERLISIQLNNERLDDALDKIGKVGGFTFSYNPTDFEVGKRVSLNADNQPIRGIMNGIFQETARFKSKNNYIIIQKNKPKEKEDFFVMGYVLDGETGLKIEKASIYEPVSLASAVTNQYGYYRIKLSSEMNNHNLMVRKANYVGEKVTLKTKQDKYINITLLPIKPIEIIKQEPPQPIQTKIEIQIEPIKPIVFRQDTLPEKKIDSLKIPPSVIEKEVSPEKDGFEDRLQGLQSEIDDFKNTVIRWFLNAKQAIHTDNIGDTLHRPFQISLMPYLGTNHTLSGNVINDVSVNVIAGYSLGNRILEVGGVANIVRGNVSGLQAAGVVNLVGKDTKGIQAAGTLNLVGRDFSGVQASGFSNINVGNTNGIQATGFGNVVVKDLTGVQASGFGNIVAGSMKLGVQATGTINIVGKNANGIQASGVFNLTGENFKGIQVTGGVNIVGKTLNGLQVGTVNISKKVKGGMQIGVLNFSGENRGLPIGLLSFVGRGGYKRLEINADELNISNLTFKTGVPALYNIFTVGYNWNIPNKPTWSYGYGLGTAVKFSKRFWMDLSVTSSVLNPQWGSNSYTNTLNKAALGLEMHITRHVAFFVAPTVNLHFSDEYNIDLGSYRLPKSEPRDVTVFQRDMKMTTWVGYQAGLRICSR